MSNTMTEKIDDNIEHSWISKEGYECWIKLLNSKFISRWRCGYVKVDKNNLTNELNNYGDVPVEVHGGLTWGSNGKWGFDCNHIYDTLEIWTLEKVKEEVNRLSEQLSKITWEDVIKSKLEYMPDWFKDRIEIKEKTK